MRPAPRRKPIRLQLYVAGDRPLGPGKVALLEAVGRSGSISAAARSLGMSYRHAWLLIDALNASFRQPVVQATPGGTRGGGARVTSFGRELVRRYRAMERATERAVHVHLRALAAHAALPARSRRGRGGEASGG